MVSSGLVPPAAAESVELAPFLVEDGAEEEAADEEAGAPPASGGNGPVRSAQSLIGSGPIMTSKASSRRPHEPKRASGLSGPISWVYMLAHLFGKLSGPE